MLQAFIGTFDSSGVRSLVPEGDSAITDAGAKFWAVIDSSEVPNVVQALLSGDRSRALKLLCNHAASIGTILPDR